MLWMFEKVTRKRYTPKSVRKDFTSFSQVFRGIREETHCFKCNKPWGDGESLAIVLFETTPNKIVCHDCADEIIEWLTQEKENK